MDIMKIQNYIGAILSYGALAQFMEWIFDSIKVQDYFNQTLSFFLANISTTLMLLIVAVYHLHKRNNRIEKILNRKGILKEEETMTFEFIKKLIGKKGFFEIDVRFLLVMMVLLMIWLMWKAGKLPF